MTTSLTVLVVGGGGREHALAWAAARSPRCARLLVAPGNAGTPGERVAIAADDVAGIVALAQREHVDLVLVGPEVALAAGVVDALTAAGIAATVRPSLNASNDTSSPASRSSSTTT